MVEFLKYVRGYLRIRVSGFSPERFMNLCSNKGILLWKIEREGDVYYMNIHLDGFRALRPIVRKTGTKVAVLERCGLPFFLPKLFRRKAFIGGLMLAVAFWMISSLFIWDIQTAGNYRITDDVFHAFLREQQVAVGMKKSGLDIGALEKEIRRTFPEITWASARLSGTKLLIEIKENDAPIITQQAAAEKGSELVTDYDGTIVAIIVRSGVPMVKVGDAVAKGDVLVAGNVPVYNEDATVREYLYVDADADIWLEHAMSFSARLPFDYIQKEYTGRTKKRFYLRIGNHEWKMPQEKPFLVYDSLIRESRPLVFEKLSIPVYQGSYTYREYKNVEHEYTLEQAETLLSEKLRTFLASLEEKGVQIIEKDVKIDTNGGSWVISGQFTVREAVGRSVLIEKSVIGETEIDE